MLVLPHLLVGERDLAPGEDLAHTRIDAPFEHELIRRRGLLEVREMRALYALLPHPHVARIEGDVVPGGPGAEHHHAAALHHETRDREGLLARMLEHDVHVALAGNVPDRLAELARLLHPGVVFGRIHLGHRTPAGELLAVDGAFGAQAHHVFTLALVRDDADRVGAGGGGELHAEHAKPARAAPHQHVVAGLERVRCMAEQHAVGGGKRERVAGRFLPGEVLRLWHQLPRLHAAELGERAVRRLVAPDALRRREQRIAAVALLVVAVVLVAVDDDLVADFPALHLGADCPDDAGGVRPGDVVGALVHVDRRDRLAEAGPHAVVIDAPGHDEDQHLVVADGPGRQHLDLHRGFRRPVALLADRPGIHLLRNMAERRDLPDFIEAFHRRRARLGNSGHARLLSARRLHRRVTQDCRKPYCSATSAFAFGQTPRDGT